MATLMRSGGLRVVIYPNDHRPSHVHVLGPEGEAVLFLRCPDGPPSLRENFGFSAREVRRSLDLVAAALGRLCAAWESTHGAGRW